MKAGVPHILEGGRGGSIVLTSSVGGLEAYPQTGHYVSAEHGVVGLMRAFAVELGQHNIRGNSVHPTHVSTATIMNEKTFKMFRPDLENPTADDMVPICQLAIQEVALGSTRPTSQWWAGPLGAGPAGPRYSAGRRPPGLPPEGGRVDSVRSTREVVDLIVELGLVDPSTPGTVLEAGKLDKPLSWFGNTDQEAVRRLLGVLGIRYAMDYETFRGIEDLDDETRLQWYRRELESIASCTRGTATVTEVRIVEDGDEEWELQFDWDGVPESWPISPGDDEEDMEAVLTFATSVRSLGGNRLGCLCSVEPADEDAGAEAVFGDPDALNRLGAHFGLTFTADPLWLRLREARRARPAVVPPVPE